MSITKNEKMADLDTLFTNPNVDIIEFTKSNFKAPATMDTIVSREDFTTPGTFKVGFPMKLDNGELVDAATSLEDIFPSDVLSVQIGATNVNKTGSTIADLLSAIETEHGPNVTARIERGQIIVNDNDIDPETDTFGMSALSISTISITTLDEVPPAVTAPIAGFSAPDALNYDRRGFEHDGNQLKGNIAQIINATGEYATPKTTLAQTSGLKNSSGEPTVDGTVLNLTGKDITGDSFDLQINLRNDANKSTFTVDGDTYTIFNNEGKPTPADEVTYQQLMDVVSMAVSNRYPPDTNPISSVREVEIDTAITTGLAADIDAAIADVVGPPSYSLSDEVKNYIVDAINYARLTPPEIEKSDEALRMADLTQYGEIVKSSRAQVDVRMDERGRIEVVDKTSSVTQARLSMFDENADNFGTPSALSFMANDALTIDEPSLNIFEDLDKIIEAVRSGTYYPDGDSSDPRNTGIHNGIERIDHILDHFTRNHTKIGSLSNALGDSQQRAELLEVNVKSVKSEIIDADYGETMMQFQQLALSYQAMMSSISKINSLSLVNFM